MGFEVEVRNVDGAVTALGAAGPFTLVVDSPAEAGGGGRGFNGGQLLHLAVAGCVSNDLFREAAQRGITLTRVAVTVDGVSDLAKTIPESVYMCFQMTFAIITPALICGSFADRMKFSALMWFMTIWSIVVALVSMRSPPI